MFTYGQNNQNSTDDFRRRFMYNILWADCDFKILVVLFISLKFMALQSRN